MAARSGDRDEWPGGHVVHMSLDHSDRKQSYSVARCDCGWESRVPWPGHYAKQDATVKAHWCAVEQGEQT